MNKRERLQPGALRTVFLSIDRDDLQHDVTELLRILAGRCAVLPSSAQTDAMEAEEGLLELAERGEQIWARFSSGGASHEAVEDLRQGGEDDGDADKRNFRWAYKQAAYRAMRPLFATETPWGCLTGIRPSKLLRGLVQRQGETVALGYMKEAFDVSEDKLALLQGILRRQEPVLASIGPKDVDLYIGIPFCRTRCQYCSFTAYALKSQDGRKGISGDKKDGYIACLLEDIRVNLRALREAGYKVRSLYVGGGTPTAIGRTELEKVLTCALDEGGGYGLEFSVEAGRPDSMDEDILRMLKDMGVSRLSINPQSMNQKTLDAIGRAHSPQDIVDTFAMARRLGFDDINMDIILGLPGEGREDFAETLGQIQALSPDGLTVHALAVKRASRLREQLREDAQSVELIKGQEAAAMQKMAEAAAIQMGLSPYYMYRQKYSAGNLENVGYAAAGKACIYNIDIMEECCPILALGAGAISKWTYPEGRLERFANPKDLQIYRDKSSHLNASRIALWKGQGS